VSFHDLLLLLFFFLISKYVVCKTSQSISCISMYITPKELQREPSTYWLVPSPSTTSYHYKGDTNNHKTRKV